MKRFLLSMVCLVFLAGCAPSSEAIQHAIEQTQAAMPTPTSLPPTYTPIPTTTETPQSTVTETPQSTVTETPIITIEPTGSGQMTYILETGFCLVSISQDDIVKRGYLNHPEDYPGCKLLERTRVTLSKGQEIKTYTSPELASKIMGWCLLKIPPDNVIFVSFDTDALGYSRCGIE